MVRKRRRFDNETADTAKQSHWQHLPEYVYDALKTPDSVRVLVLEPSINFNADLEGEIVQYRRSEMGLKPNSHEHYNAMSYAWGERNFTCQLLCNRQQSTLQITPTVDSMLRHMRATWSCRYLWIDAVCLNQADATEKGQQVPLMGEIYDEAKEVWIWLGEAIPQIRNIFKLLEYATLLHKRKKKQRPLQAVKSAAKTLFGDSAHEAITSFLQIQWFSRRWILQEAASSRVTMVCCGFESIVWSWFMDGIRTLNDAVQAGLQVDSKIRSSLESMSTVTDIETDLLDLFWLHHTAECSDPRDRLFALLPLLKEEILFIKGSEVSDSEDEASEGECPDDNRPVAWYEDFSYRNKWSDSYRQCAIKCIEKGLGYKLLCHIIGFGRARDLDESLESWVPNWSQSRSFVDSLPGPTSTRSISFEQEWIPSDVLTFEAGSNKKVLLRACVQGQVVHIAKIEASNTSRSNVRTILRQFLYRLKYRRSCETHDDQSAEDVTIPLGTLSSDLPVIIGRILSASPSLFQRHSTFFSDTSFVNRGYVACKIEGWLNHLMDERTVPGFWDDDLQDEDLLELRDQIETEDFYELVRDTEARNVPDWIHRLLSEYSLYQLCSGFVGLGPRELQKGDLVVDFPNGRLPGKIIVPAPHGSRIFAALHPMVPQPRVLCDPYVNPPKSRIVGPCFSPMLQCRDIVTSIPLC